MRVLATALILFAGPGPLLADARTDLEILRARCGEQERQIRALEAEIESLHGQLALERRRSRGADPSAASVSPPTPAPDAAPAAPAYTVKSGDTLSSIASRYRTSADHLMKSNGIDDPTRLRVGQKLILPVDVTTPATSPKTPAPAPSSALVQNPGPAASTTQAAPAASASKPPAQAPTSQAAATTTYLVQRGDTLYGIARKHKMSIGDIKSLNPKVGEKIVAGQSLAIAGAAKAASTPIPSLRSSTSKTISTAPSSPAPKPASLKTPEAKPKAQAKAEPKPAPSPVAKSEPKPQTKPAPSPVAKSEPQPQTKPAAPSPAAEPEPTPALVAEAPASPAPAVIAATTPAPAAASAAPHAPAPKSISSIIVMDEVSLGDLATKHGTTTEQLNALNNWNYKSSLILARGSEVYVPGS